MIRKIEFENFMSLREVSVELDPFTVFVGRNSSGKSAIFKGLVMLSRLLSAHPAPVRGPRGEFLIEPGVTIDDIVWTGNKGLPIKFRLWFDNDKDAEPGYSLELRKGRAGWSVAREAIRVGDRIIEIDEDHPFQHPTERLGNRTLTAPLPGTLSYMVRGFLNDENARTAIEPIMENSNRIGEAWRYRPSAYDIAAFSSPESSRRFVSPNGRGVAPALQELQGRKRDVFEKIEGRLHDMLPHIKTIGFDATPDGIRLNFMSTRCNNLVPAPQESDGVLLATFLCWRLYTAEPPMTICLEEPENGFYLDLLEKRYDLLREFSVPQDGAAVQILVSTQSVEFLRVLKRHHSDFPMVRSVEFLDGEGSRVESLAHYRDAANLLDHFVSGGSLLPSMWKKEPRTAG